MIPVKHGTNFNPRGLDYKVCLCKLSASCDQSSDINGDDPGNIFALSLFIFILQSFLKCNLDPGFQKIIQTYYFQCLRTPPYLPA